MSGAANTGVLEGVVRFDADEYSFDGGVIGRAKVDHKHADFDKTSQFTIKGFGPFGEAVAGLSAGQTVKVKYELTLERWQSPKDSGDWKQEVVLKVIDLKAGDVPEQEPKVEEGFTAVGSATDGDDIPF
ncbi:MAG: hypothetical protein DRI46_12025 [Chloroflexi bacterium]|nr:MAG: hypothetical protein DRI46_12025 [Chloroflexota bacterium]